MNPAHDDTTLYLLGVDLPWWPAFARLRSDAGDAERARGSMPARATVLRALVRGRWADPETALADALLFGASDAWSSARDAAGVRRALVDDLRQLTEQLAAVAAREPRGEEPPLRALATPPTGAVADLRDRIRDGTEADRLVEHVLVWRERHGGGPLGRYRAARWRDGRLVGIARPATPRLEGLVDLAGPIEVLRRNTEAFLDGRPAMHALLYGPRGSGKSTVVRGLLTRYADRGLRLIELPAHDLTDLPSVLERLRGRPERFILFVDDLAFEAGDARYHPLKTLLEGSVEARPDHVRLYATSNRRHLVQERLRDRPDPLDDDVHAWDTQNERLALADRFGLLVTFPSADRHRFLAIVRTLAERAGVSADELEARADRFARAGNGYSGRTAQQFLDAFQAGLA